MYICQTFYNFFLNSSSLSLTYNWIIFNPWTAGKEIYLIIFGIKILTNWYWITNYYCVQTVQCTKYNKNIFRVTYLFWQHLIFILILVMIDRKSKILFVFILFWLLSQYVFYFTRKMSISSFNPLVPETFFPSNFEI